MYCDEILAQRAPVATMEPARRDVSADPGWRRGLPHQDVEIGCSLFEPVEHEQEIAATFAVKRTIGSKGDRTIETGERGEPIRLLEQGSTIVPDLGVARPLSKIGFEGLCRFLAPSKVGERIAAVAFQFDIVRRQLGGGFEAFEGVRRVAQKNQSRATALPGLRSRSQSNGTVVTLDRFRMAG